MTHPVYSVLDVVPATLRPAPPDPARDDRRARGAGESISTALQALPPGWRLDKRAWDAVTRYAFLEYYFLYAYNDFERYQTTPFDNEHEGDDERCWLVFDRNV